MAQSSTYINEFIKESYDRVGALLPKGMLARFKAAIGDLSVNAALNAHILAVVEEHEQRTGQKIVAVTLAQAAELLGWASAKSVSKAVSRGHLKYAAFAGETGERLVALDSVKKRAGEIGIDISEKLKAMGIS